MAAVAVGSRNTHYWAPRYGLTQTGLPPVGLHQLSLAPSEMKAKALAKCELSPDRKPKNRWRDQPDLMEFLRSL